MTPTPDKPSFFVPQFLTHPYVVKLLAAALILLLVLVRVAYPGSDAYARLTWSSALLTDEGFYIHNARNLILFGHARTDEFNNALIMPLLHLAQILVFRVFGVGAMQARSISIVASLLTLLVLGDALRRIWGLRCAWLGVVLLGLDPVFALYNRLALMDTPACLPLCLAFWLWTIAQGREGRGEEETRRRGDTEKRRRGEGETRRRGEEEKRIDAMENLAGENLAGENLAGAEQTGAAHEGQTQGQTQQASVSVSPLLLFSVSPLLPLFFCGLCLGLAYCARGLTAVVAPVPLLLLAQQAWRQYKQQTANGKPGTEEPGTATRRSAAPLLRFSSVALLPVCALLAGLTVVLLAYVVLWYLPNKIEMAHVNRFYLHEQLLPRSAAQFGRNFWGAFADRHRGVFPFFIKHSPVLLLLNGYWLFEQIKRRYLAMRQTAQNAKVFSPPDNARQSASESSLRQVHYQVHYDDCTGERDLIAADMCHSAGQTATQKRQCIYFLAGWLFTFLIFVSIVDYAPSRYYVMFYPALAGIAAITLDNMIALSRQNPMPRVRRVVALLCVLWVGLNAYWYADWAGHLTYRQQAADTWLAAHLPKGSVLMGAVTPGLCLNNRFKCVVMIENLCNYHAPVEQFAAAPRYVVILDTDADAERNLRLPSQRLWANRWKEKWWLRHYPSVVRHDKRLHSFPHLLRRYFTVGVYPVPADYTRVKRQIPRIKRRIRPFWRDSVSSLENMQSELLLEH